MQICIFTFFFKSRILRGVRRRQHDCPENDSCSREQQIQTGKLSRYQKAQLLFGNTAGNLVEPSTRCCADGKHRHYCFILPPAFLQVKGGYRIFRGYYWTGTTSHSCRWVQSSFVSQKLSEDRRVTKLRPGSWGGCRSCFTAGFQWQIRWISTINLFCTIINYPASEKGMQYRLHLHYFISVKETGLE